MITLSNYREDRFNSAKLYILQSLFYLDDSLLPFLINGGKLDKNKVKIELIQPTPDINVISFEHNGFYDLIFLYKLTCDIVNVNTHVDLKNYLSIFKDYDQFVIENIENFPSTLEVLRKKRAYFMLDNPMEMLTLFVEPSNDNFDLNEVIDSSVKLINSNRISPFMFLLKSDNYKTKILTQLNSGIYNDDFFRVMLQLNLSENGIQ